LFVYLVVSYGDDDDDDDYDKIIIISLVTYFHCDVFIFGCRPSVDVVMPVLSVCRVPPFSGMELDADQTRTFRNKWKSLMERVFCRGS
jgi:hypothetical protein